MEQLLLLLSCAAVVLADLGQSPTSTLSMQVTTWSVNTKPPPSNLTDLLGLERDPDFVVLALQTSAPSYERTYELRSQWRLATNSVLLGKGGYQMVLWSSAQGISMGLYVKAPLEDVLTDVRAGAYPTRGQDYGDWVVLTVYGRRLLFLNARLADGEDNLNLRVEDFNVVENKTNELYDNVDYKFWFGDLNFRLKDRNELTAEVIADRIDKGQESEVLDKDELKCSMKEGKAFQGYSEMQINFKPTYKFKVGSNSYNLTERPAWTDRVLYKVREAEGREITPVHYGSITHYNISDHKPVEAFFRLSVDPQKKS